MGVDRVRPMAGAHITAEQMMKSYPGGLERLKEDWREFTKNSKWLAERNLRLSDEYKNEYVAVLRGKIVDHDPDCKALWVRLRKKYADRIHVVAVEYIPEKNIMLVF
ncbi:MAG: hypothetical protein HZB92_01630 [Euryarchaeota archaeon]|nr:hypothetical protein [Euryarchaeota archaeon]